jgi:hypothetical protein
MLYYFHIISCSTDSVLKTGVVNSSSVVAPSCTADVVTVYALVFPTFKGSFWTNVLSFLPSRTFYTSYAKELHTATAMVSSTGRISRLSYVAELTGKKIQCCILH